MKIPFSPPDITEEEIEQVSEALRSGWITTGPKTKELEKEVAEFCGVSKAVSVSALVFAWTVKRCSGQNTAWCMGI